MISIMPLLFSTIFPSPPLECHWTPSNCKFTKTFGLFVFPAAKSSPDFHTRSWNSFELFVWLTVQTEVIAGNRASSAYCTQTALSEKWSPARPFSSLLTARSGGEKWNHGNDEEAGAGHNRKAQKAPNAQIWQRNMLEKELYFNSVKHIWWTFLDHFLYFFLCGVPVSCECSHMSLCSGWPSNNVWERRLNLTPSVAHFITSRIYDKIRILAIPLMDGSSCILFWQKLTRVLKRQKVTKNGKNVAHQCGSLSQ